MRSWLKIVITIIGVFFLLMSAIWFLAMSSSGFPAYLVFQFMGLFLFGAVPIAIVILASWKEKKDPVTVHQNINIDAVDLVGGTRSYEKLKCSNCGAGLESKDVKFTTMGLVVNCPYCDQVYTIEEEPTW